MSDNLSLEEAKNIVGSLEDGLQKQREEKGWDVGFVDDFSEELPAPTKVRLIRRATVYDGMEAKRIAKMHYDPDNKMSNYPLPEQVAAAKLALLVQFDGKQLSLLEIDKFGEDFFTHVLVSFAKYLGSG